MLERIAKSPYLNMLAGIVLIITAGYETWESFGEYKMGTHHGVLVFGFVQVIKALPETLHGVKEIREGEENFENHPDS
jgi:hypothetical protein